jgi:hypothetical protein
VSHDPVWEFDAGHRRSGRVSIAGGMAKAPAWRPTTNPARALENAHHARRSMACDAGRRARERVAAAGGDREQAAAAAAAATERVLAKPVEAFLRPSLVLTPRSEIGSERYGGVLEALRDEGLFVRRLRAVNARVRTQSHVHDAWMGLLLAEAAAVFVLPRADGTIGAGTLRDIRLTKRRHRVQLVTPDRRLVPLREVPFVETTDGAGRPEGRFEFPVDEAGDVVPVPIGSWPAGPKRPLRHVAAPANSEC